MDTKQHHWRTRYLTTRQVDCASGVECLCGASLSSDQVEDRLNTPQDMRHVQHLEQLIDGRAAEVVRLQGLLATLYAATPGGAYYGNASIDVRTYLAAHGLLPDRRTPPISIGGVRRLPIHYE